jgi:hypothetical protein
VLLRLCQAELPISGSRGSVASCGITSLPPPLDAPPPLYSGQHASASLGLAISALGIGGCSMIVHKPAHQALYMCATPRSSDTRHTVLA